MTGAAHVSVVIPTYNARHYVRAAIDSALRQTMPPLEVIVIDDGSTDDTGDELRSYGSAIRYVAQANQGVARARNRGASEARGRYVAFLDADDVWHAPKLERQLARLRAGSASVCYSAFRLVDAALAPRGEHRGARRGGLLEDLLFVGNVVGTPSTVVCDRALFLDAGGFDPALSQCADWEMWIRLAARAEFAAVDEPLVDYRVHERNMSRDVALLERDSVKTLEKAFALPGLPEALRRRRHEALAHNWMVLAGSYFRAGARGAFLRSAVRAVAHDRRQLAYLFGFWGRRVARRGVAAEGPR